VLVNSIIYNLDQDGVNQLAQEVANSTSYAEEERRQDPTSSYVLRYEHDAKAATEALDRIARVTGLQPGQVAAPTVRAGGSVQQALQAATDPTQTWTARFLAALGRGFLGTSQHEHGHNGQRTHGTPFSSFLGAIAKVTTLPEIQAIVDEMMAELDRSGGLRAMAADLEQHSRIIASEDIFSKVSVEEKGTDAAGWSDWPADPSAPQADRQSVEGVETSGWPLHGGGTQGTGTSWTST
jgi:hypothetical protein